MTDLNEQLRIYANNGLAIIDRFLPDGDIERGMRIGLEDMRDLLPTNDVRMFFATMAEWFRQTAPHGPVAYGEMEVYRDASLALGLGELLDLQLDDALEQAEGLWILDHGTEIPQA